MDDIFEVSEAPRKVEVIEKVENDETKSFSFVRYNNDELVKLYDKLTSEGKIPKCENKSYDLKIIRAYSHISRLLLVEEITKYYEKIFNDLVKLVVLEGSYNYQYSKDLKIVIEEDTVMKRHKVNAKYKLCSSTLNNLIEASLQESGNCCGSMLLSQFNCNTGAFSKLNKVFIYMIYDITIALRTTNLLALNVKERQYTKDAIEKYGFKEIHTFVNRNSDNTVSILSKEIPRNLIKEEIIIKYE